jgi:hypothetical protein
MKFCLDQHLLLSIFIKPVISIEIQKTALYIFSQTLSFDYIIQADGLGIIRSL